MHQLANIRKTFLSLLLLASVFPARPAAADPLQVTSGAFVLDIEGDMFTFTGSGFSLISTAIGLYAPKQFPGRCESTGLGFCREQAGALADWSFQTTGGEQLLGRGSVALDGLNATDVDFVGAMQFNVDPTPVTPNASGDFDLIAPFSFLATIRGMRGGEEVFARQLAGLGRVSVNYEGTLTPGVFAAADETIVYAFAGAPAATPEPTTVLLFGSGLAAAALTRRRREKNAAASEPGSHTS